MPFIYTVEHKAYSPHGPPGYEAVPAHFKFVFSCDITIQGSFGGMSTPKSRIYPTFLTATEIWEAWIAAPKTTDSNLRAAINLAISVLDCGIDDVKFGSKDLTVEEVMELTRKHVDSYVKECEDIIPDEEESMVLHWIMKDPSHSMAILSLVRTWLVHNVSDQISHVRKGWTPDFRYYKGRMESDLYHILVKAAEFYWENHK